MARDFLKILMSQAIGAPKSTLETVVKRYESFTMPPGAMEHLFAPLLFILSQDSQMSSALQCKNPENVVIKNADLRPSSLLFAADHGVASSYPISAFPQSITGRMVKNILRGGAAISVLCKKNNVTLAVTDVGVAWNQASEIPYEFSENNVTNDNLTPCFFFRNPARFDFADTVASAELVESRFVGSADITKEPALSDSQFKHAFEVGREILETISNRHQPNLIIVGEMGIGNTTSAAAVTCALLGLDPIECVGAGTGLTNLSVKCDVVRQALVRHQKDPRASDPLFVLQSLGGFELVSMAGAIYEASVRRVPTLLDGYIATSAVCALAKAIPNVNKWLIAGHLSEEVGHALLLKELNLSPLLQLSLRLGEGSGALIATSLLYDALAMFKEMASFGEL